MSSKVESKSTPQQMIPWDVITDILTQLPPKSLVRFRSVSKSWLSHIDHPHFTHSHSLLHSTSNNLHLLLRGPLHSHLFHLLHPPLPPHSIPGPPGYYEASIIGSCRGLLALHDSDGNLAIWNPCTRKHWILPVSAAITLGLCSVVFILLGFGYDSSKNEYKLVRIAQLHSDYDDDFHTQVDIYTWGSTSWRPLQGFPTTGYIRAAAMEGHYGVLSNEALHWGTSPRFPLLAVGLRREEYWEVEQPSYGDEEEGWGWGLGVLGGKLSVTRFEGGVGMVVWVMKEYGVKESWSRLARVRFPDHHHEGIGGCLSLGLDYVWPLVYDDGKGRWGRVLVDNGGEELVWLEVEKGSEGLVKKIAKMELANDIIIPKRFVAWTLVGSLAAVDA